MSIKSKLIDLINFKYIWKLYTLLYTFEIYLEDKFSNFHRDDYKLYQKLNFSLRRISQE